MRLLYVGKTSPRFDCVIVSGEVNLAFDIWKLTELHHCEIPRPVRRLMY